MLLHSPAGVGQGEPRVDAGGRDARGVGAAVSAVVRDRVGHLGVVGEVDRGVVAGCLPVGAETRLRRRLARPDRPPYVQNVWGVGYCLLGD